MCVLGVEGNEEGEGECLAGFRDVSCKEPPNPACEFGPPVLEENEEGESEGWAGFRAVVGKEEPNPASKFGTPEKVKFLLLIVIV